MPFKPGQSGNPAGRPKVVGDVQALARKHTSEAIQTLATIMRSAKAPPAARTAAASALLDRGYGRPAQAIEATLNRKSVQDMSDAELLAIAASGDDDEEPSALTH